VRSVLRILYALAIAGLASAVWLTHVFVEFHPIRAKVVQAPIPAVDGTVRVTTAGFPQLKGLRPPFALIARIKAPSTDSLRIRIAFDGSPTCERTIAGGASRRVDCAVTAGHGAAADREVVVSGPSTPWTLEYLELATHHGNATGAMTSYIVPPGSSAYRSPAAGWTLVVWAGVAALLLWVAPHAMSRRVRLAHLALTGLVIALLAVIQSADRLTDFRVVLGSSAFLLWLALALAPRLWTAGRWLADRADPPARRAMAASEARLAAFFDAHPAWRLGGASAKAAWHWSALALVVVFFCVPLFINLREPDLQSDEAIHSWAVDRILDTGDWLTPGSLPDDSPFIEKPPLKFWLVAAGIRSGLLPRNELGMRWFDALFGAVAFVYVYLLGRRLSGPLCGLTAVLVLFTLDPLVFVHGLRSNNMDAAMFLCYCGGLFHFAKWAEADMPRARGHAVAAAAYFVLGFMTKFVAAVFLPAVCVVALAWRRGGWARLRSGWRDWIGPALLVCALVAPWFIYQTVKRGSGFWHIIAGEHVFKRFTASLDPTHVHPWNHYFVETWKALQRAGTHWVVLAGIARLAVAAVRGESWLSRLVLVWGVLPVVAMSLGTSKLLHYAYPFWPAIALGAGLVVADAAHVAGGAPGVAALAWLRRFVPLWVTSWCVGRRTAVIAISAIAGAAAAWAALSGPFTLGAGGIGFRISSVVWPLATACLLLFLGGYLRTLLRMAVVAALIALVPVSVYTGEIARAKVIDHPFRAVRECVTAVQQSGVKVGPGVYGAYVDMPHWTYYYYLWRLNESIVTREFSLDEAERRLRTPAEQTPVLVSRANYDTLVRRAAERVAPGPGVVGRAAASSDAIADAARDPMRSGVRLDANVGLLLPGPFQACLPDILAAAGQPLWKTPAPEPRR
jgi:4-amino-4-deoxy-L-arabinose transferase-like glycosyltransferase